MASLKVEAYMYVEFYLLVSFLKRRELTPGVRWWMFSDDLCKNGSSSSSSCNIVR